MHKELNIDLGALMDNLPGMAFRCLNDADLTIEYASRGSVDLLGYEPRELIRDKAFRKMVHPDDQDRNKTTLGNLSVAAPRYRMIYRIKTAHGQNRWVMEEGKALFSAQGRFRFIEGLLTDITDQKVVELELHRENLRLKSSMGQRFRLEKLIGKSDAMQRVYDLIIKMADADAPVVITGESGTGKELAAHAIHSLSPRSGQAFIPVNCGAIPETLLEREFFGHRRGSFSGAMDNKPGYLDLARGGTRFLDEVGEISLNFQTKLLRALDGIGYTPIGGRMPRSSDFRLICATHRDLGEMVRAGQMREDFFYRIQVVPLKMPPLRDRREDIPLLMEHFLKGKDGGPGLQDIPGELRNRLESHHWHGNVRELKNVIHRYLTLGSLEFENLTTRETPSAPEPGSTLPRVLATYEEQLIKAALFKHRWKKTATATDLGITLRTLQRKIKRYGIS